MLEERLGRLLASRPCADLAREGAEFPGRVALVGGALRDAALELPPRDLDLIVEGDLDAFIDRLEARLGRRPAAIGDRFQDTHRFRWAGTQVDVARAAGTVAEDLVRRDFTINALALPFDRAEPTPGDLLDVCGGLADLQAGRLRETAPGVLEADPLRALRAVRYSASLPGFALEPTTRNEVERVAPLLETVAAERKVAEWAEILQLTHWVRALDLARATGVAAASLGSLATLDAVRAWDGGEDEGNVDARGRFAALVCDLSAGCALEEVLDRLREARWPRSLVRHAERVVRWRAVDCACAEDLARRALEDPAAAADAAALSQRMRGESEGAARLARFAGHALEDRWVRGADLLGSGMSPGPQLGRLLEEVAVGQVTRRWERAEEALAWARDRAGEAGRER